MNFSKQIAFCVLPLLGITVTARAQNTPVIPIAGDAYTMLDRWPLQRIGVRAYMRSTYDRAGGNEGADASHFLYQEGNLSFPLDVEGPGVLYFVRYNHWHGSPWHYFVDGVDHVVTEASTKDPLHPAAGATFEPANVFPEPMTQTWAATKGADLSWTPIVFEKSLRMAYERTHYGTGYYIFDRIAPGTKLSRELKSWNAEAPDEAAVQLFNRAGSDLSPKDAQHHDGLINVPKSDAVTLADLKSSGVIRAINLSVPRDQAEFFSNTRLRITWDNRREPSVDAPIGLFFGAGALYNRDNREWLVKAIPVNVHYTPDRVELACYFPMPFFTGAKVELVGNGTPISDVHWSIRTIANNDKPGDVGYFHATYIDHGDPVRGHDLTFLNTRNIEGSQDWSGSFIGTSFIFSHTATLSTLEGDPRFFFDDSLTPQAQGTGTEEWAGGGDYWGGENMTLPLAGHPIGVKNRELANDERDKIESGYRFLVADLFPFGKNARICLEHGGTDESVEHYESVAYWYGWPSPSLVQTDTLQVGDTESETRHAYQSPEASAPYEITSRYEWGVDHLRKDEIYPASTDHGRTTAGTSEFTLTLRPDNLGVLLRRKLDYQFANQCAEVFIADVDKENWTSVGTWYTAGSNTCVYSNPHDELGAIQHRIQTSNRRFRDDEFLIGRDVTKAKSAIRIRVKFTPVNRALFPGGPDMPTAWSEMRYDCYCYVKPT